MEQSLVNGVLPFTKYGQQNNCESLTEEEYKDKKYKADYQDL